MKIERQNPVYHTDIKEWWKLQSTPEPRTKRVTLCLYTPSIVKVCLYFSQITPSCDLKRWGRNELITLLTIDLTLPITLFFGLKKRNFLPETLRPPFFYNFQSDKETRDIIF